MTPVRVGVVGLGWAGRTHLAAHAAVPGAVPVALACAEEPLLREVGAEYGITGLHTDWQDLVARDDVDAISIAAPNHLHLPIALAALRGGKHVLCEKPLARNAIEAAAMAAQARASERVLMTCFDKRHRGDVQALREQVEAGALGRVYYAKAHWMRRRRVPPGGSWFTRRELAGGGPLIDLGVHVLDLALVLLGEPEVRSVSAATFREVAAVGDDFDVEDLATAMVRLDGGAVLHLETSWAAHGSAGDDFGLVLYGSLGGAALDIRDYADADTLTLYRDVDGEPRDVTPEVPAVAGHPEVVRRFHAAVRSGDWARHDGAEGVRRAEVIDACYASAAAGAEVAL
ncbi:MAG: hypothetical protein QOE45_2560 [Frankiaceae bacterium]|nr:hypothetical protein [Frankiaceae bacterium]